jgi:hypothetical protein
MLKLQYDSISLIFIRVIFCQGDTNGLLELLPLGQSSRIGGRGALVRVRSVVPNLQRNEEIVVHVTVF